jgi:hypothetical protein
MQVRAHSVIIATGAVAKRLGLPHEEEFWNNGISACAVCDGASANFRKQELAVVGGGDTAAEEALYLTKYGTKVGRGDCDCHRLPGGWPGMAHLSASTPEYSTGKQAPWSALQA